MNKFGDLFNRANKSNYNIYEHNMFPNKEILDSYRRKILKLIIETDMPINLTIDEFIKKVIDNVVSETKMSNIEKSYIYNMINNEITGYGPLTELLEQTNISTIMINGINNIYLEVDGKLYKDNSINFLNDNHIIRTIERIIEPLGYKLDKNNPILDITLDNNIQLNVVIPPISKNPIITIRRVNNVVFDGDDVLRNGTMTPYMVRFLEACVLAKLNIFVTGASLSGKTTILNVLTSFIEENKRIIIMDDSKEIICNNEHVVNLKIYNKDVIDNTLYMNADYTIINEVEENSLTTLLKLLDNANMGVITTFKSSNIETMVSEYTRILKKDNLDIDYINSTLKDKVNIVVEVSKLDDNRRKVTKISEFIIDDNKNIVINDIFAYTLNEDNEYGFILYENKFNAYNLIKSRNINKVDDIFSYLTDDKKNIKKGKNKINLETK